MRCHAVFAALLVGVSLFGNAAAFGQTAAEQASPRTIDIASHVAEAAQRFGIPEGWIYAVMRTESAGKIGAVSSKGAMGLMQLMPGTWARQRTRFGLGPDPFNPRDNIMAGASYLREMYDNYGPSGFLAAYNAGPGRYEQYRDDGRPLPAETRTYVARIAPMLQTADTHTIIANTSTVQPVRTSWTQSELFVARSDSSDGASGSFAAAAPPQPAHASNAQLNGLFAPVSGSRPQ